MRLLHAGTCECVLRSCHPALSKKLMASWAAGISWQLPVATSAANGWRQLDDNAQWTGPSMAECAQLTGRRAIVDIYHQPTALQVRSRLRLCG